MMRSISMSFPQYPKSLLRATSFGLKGLRSYRSQLHPLCLNHHPLNLSSFYTTMAADESKQESVKAFNSGVDYDEGTYLSHKMNRTPFKLIECCSDNVFSKIIAGKIPCYKIFENDDVLAILDAFPSAPGHSLLISKVRKATIMDFTAEEAANYLKYLPKLSQMVMTATGCSGTNVIANSGYDAGQRVYVILAFSTMACAISICALLKQIPCPFPRDSEEQRRSLVQESSTVKGDDICR